MPSRFKVILRTDDTIELDREAVTLVEARLAPIDENENIRQKAEDNKRKQSELERRPTFSEPEGTRMKMNPKTFVRVLPTVGGELLALSLICVVFNNCCCVAYSGW